MKQYGDEECDEEGPKMYQTKCAENQILGIVGEGGGRAK